MDGFFYGQTEYNYLENAISLEKYVEYCSKYGYEFITLTDKNLHGYYKFYNLCVKNNIKPVIGLKIHLSESLDNNLLVYAKNELGVQNLFKLSKLQEENKFVTIEIVEQYRKNLFFVIPNDNIIYKAIKDNKIELAVEETSKLKVELYLGITGNEEINVVNNFLFDTRLSILPMSNCSYLFKNDYKVYQTLKKIGNSKTDDFATHLKTKEELKDDLSNFDVFDTNFIKDINYNFTNKISLPIYSSDITDSGLYLKELSTKGLQRRLQLKNKTDLYDNYLKRLNHELEIISYMGYDDYFLIVWDLIKYSKKEGILVGPGRGSAAGSLVSFCLGITEIDPLEYDLYFERFLNPHRVTMPDIDIDFPDNKREEVIQYVKNKYGENHVCYISAFNTFGVKSSIRDICRVNNVNVDHASLMLKHIDNYGLEDAIEKYSSRPELFEVLSIANKISGLIRHISTHAAGIILSSVNLDDYVPLRLGVNGVYQSQLEASDLEKIGFLKIDFLGIRNLTLVDNMCKHIEGLKLNDIPLDDVKTFELLKKGDTNGIFQLESVGIKNVLRKLKPSSFNDIVSVLALYRPGPMENIDSFIKGKESGKVKYLIKDLEPILKNTYGIIVYQEQIMEIANVICGYTYAEADILRRAVSKKDKNILDNERNIFVNKAKLKGYNPKVSNEIYDLIVKFADYGFNKSHSVAYAKLSYEMAYLKANYPIIFISEMINNVVGDDKELSHYINYAKMNNIDVVTPKINHSSDRAIIIKNRILLPFQVIHKLGNATAKLIISKREESKFESFEDFKERTMDFINVNNLNYLIFSNAFDEFKLTKKSMIQKSETNNAFAKYVTDSISDNDDYEFDYLKQKELEVLGFNLNYDIFKENEFILNKYKIIRDVSSFKENKKLLFVVYVDNIRNIETKNNEIMAFVDLDLNFTKMSGVVFPKIHQTFTSLDFKKLILIEGVIQNRNDELQIVINKCRNIEK